MSNPKKVLVVHSPHSGRAAELQNAVDYLRQAAIDVVDMVPIASLDGLPAQGERWREQGIEAVVAAGGDGLVGGVTMHTVQARMPVGILPLGTANDIARSLALPMDLMQAAAVIAQGREIMIDIGEARPAEQKPHAAAVDLQQPVARRLSRTQLGFFAHAATVGLNVHFARLATNVATRQRYGHLTYPVAALEVLRLHTAMDVELQIEGLALAQTRSTINQPAMIHNEDPVQLQCRAVQVAVVNAPVFGGRWQLAVPGATLHDHLLDVVVLEEMRFEDISAALMQFFQQDWTKPAVLNPWHLRYPHLQAAEFSGIPGLHHLRVRALTVTTALDPQDVTLDGEVRGQTPMQITISPTPLHVFVP